MDGGITSKGSAIAPASTAGRQGRGARCSTRSKGYESDDMFTAIPKALIPKEPYASFVVADDGGAGKPLKGMRVGVVREFMVKHTKNDEAISDQIDKEIKTVLRDKLGAELVESVDPLYADDPAVPNMKYTFQDAFAEILPHNVPEYFWQTTRAGELEFAVPGWDVTTVDYAVALAMRKAPLSHKINLRRISDATWQSGEPVRHEQVPARARRRRGSRTGRAGWRTRSSRATRSGPAPRTPSAIRIRAPNADSVSYLKMQSVLRMVVLKVMYENNIDVFVNPEQTTAAVSSWAAPASRR